MLILGSGLVRFLIITELPTMLIVAHIDVDLYPLQPSY